MCYEIYRVAVNALRRTGAVLLALHGPLALDLVVAQVGVCVREREVAVCVLRVVCR